MTKSETHLHCCSADNPFEISQQKMVQKLASRGRRGRRGRRYPSSRCHNTANHENRGHHIDHEDLI